MLDIDPAEKRDVTITDKIKTHSDKTQAKLFSVRQHFLKDFIMTNGKQ